jgi:hypothetical protein
MLVAMVAVMVALFATAAYAATIEGDDNANALFETRGDDQLFGFGGGDVLDANNYGGDTDVLRGGFGDDHLLANDGETRDTVFGGSGYDVCVVNAPSEIGGGCERVRVR